MPELFSRMDNHNWLTPSIADILDQGSAPPGGDGSIRKRMLTIQQELDDLETPARIVNVRSTPSYTLYVARPEAIGRRSNRRTVSATEIKQSIKMIADNHQDWLLGYIPQLRQEDNAVGILLRTQEHRPISLRRLLVRSTFRKHLSTLAVVLGVTLEQKMLVNSIDTIGHMLVIGNDNAKQHFIRSTLLTLIMLNTPAELRIAIAGASSDAYKYLVGAPHALGRILTSPTDGQRLIDGLIKEIQRRKQSIKDAGASNFEEFNQFTKTQDKTALPRIVLIIDSLTDESWQSLHEQWADSITKILDVGISVGIHLILTADDEDYLNIQAKARRNISLRIVTRTASKDISSSIPNFHNSLLRFIDAFVLRENQAIEPVELCAVSNTEIKNVVEYWRGTSKQRYQELQLSKTIVPTGVTSLLTAVPELEIQESPLSSPPTPEKPSAAALERATQKLGSGMPTEQNEPEKLSKSIEKPQDIDEAITTPHMLAEETMESIPESTTSDVRFEQAVALTAYLGWVSEGALCEIFYIPTHEASALIQQLKDQKIVEDADYPTLRLIKPIQP